VDFFGGTSAALGVADDPANRVAGGDRAGANKLLAILQLDVGDLAGGGVGLIERARRIGIDLHSVDEAVAIRLHACGGIGAIDAHLGVRGLRRLLSGRERFQLARQGQRLRQLDDLDRRRRLDRERRRRGGVIVDIGRDERMRTTA